MLPCGYGVLKARGNLCEVMKTKASKPPTEFELKIRDVLFKVLSRATRAQVRHLLAAEAELEFLFRLVSVAIENFDWAKEAKRVELVEQLIDIERKLRARSEMKGHIRLADRLRLARRGLQEELGLVLTVGQVEELVRGDKRRRKPRNKK
jgi:hypothetical protein